MLVKPKITLSIAALAAFPFFIKGMPIMAVGLLANGLLFLFLDWFTGQSRPTDQDFWRMHPEKCWKEFENFRMLPPSGNEWDKYCDKHNITLEDILGMIKSSN